MVNLQQGEQEENSKITDKLMPQNEPTVSQLWNDIRTHPDPPL